MNSLPKVLSRSQVRSVDARAIDELGMAGVVLMENAARGCVDWLLDLGVAGPVSVCAGKGNNGGDGFVIARHLSNLGFEVRTLLFAAPQELTGDARCNFEILHRSAADIRVLASSERSATLHELAGSAWIIDALLGTGTQRVKATADSSGSSNQDHSTSSIREPFYSAIESINASSAKVMAIDLPSGMDCDTGEPVDDSAHCIQADFTATFVAKKQGFDCRHAAEFLGTVRVIDIGIPHAFLSRIFS